MTDTNIKFYKVASLPTSGYVVGGVYFCKADKKTYIRTSTGWEDFSGIVDSSLNSTSTNPVQNKVINSALSGKANTSHTHTKSEVGLGNVDNTADANKSVKYATSAGSATTATTATTATKADKLTTPRTIDLGTAVTSTATSFSGESNITIPVNSVKEAYLEWGGKNFAGSYGPIDAAMISTLGANRLAFGKPDGIIIEYSRDSGSTWIDYEATDLVKQNLFSGIAQDFGIGKNDSTNKATAAYMLRITIDTKVFGVYTTLNKFMIYCSTNGSSGCYCTIQKALQSDPTYYETVVNQVGISGWSGYNIINISGVTTYGNKPTSQYGRLRFIFGCTGVADANYSGLWIHNINGFGGVGWATPSVLAKTGHLYSIDTGQTAVFPANVDASTLSEEGTSLANKYAAKSHTHTKSQITDFPTSLKNPNAITIKGNSTELVSYDGSAAKTVNIAGSGAVTVSADTSASSIVIDATSLIEKTYSELKTLKTNSTLIPGQYYRITDFVTTSSQSGTRSAGHPFDVIVRADASNVLNEDAWAIQHSGDTYFANAKLEAWQLKYCLDNDTTRFAWASSSGKGVIYRMIDEWGNDLPYDFKNIQFLMAEVASDDPIRASWDASLVGDVWYRATYGSSKWTKKTGNTIYAYTFNKATITDDVLTLTDASILGTTENPYNNSLGVRISSGKQYLNEIVWMPYVSTQSISVYGNHFGENNYKSCLSTYNCYGCKTGANCYNFYVSNSCSSWTCESNCNSWACGNSCYLWACGNNCHSWTCGNACSSWTCGDACYSWTCGNSCNSWICESNCNSWTCGNSCYSWTCGNSCHSWTCGNTCHSWTCGNYCHTWTCGNSCHTWTCGNYCHSWTCGDSCHSWTCGNYCYSWTCGNYCYSWTCGNYCYSWTCGTSATTIASYQRYFKLGNGVSNIFIDCQIGSSYRQNWEIKEGIQGASSDNRLTIKIDSSFPVNASYKWTIAKNSAGEIKQYCEANELARATTSEIDALFA